MNPWTRLVRALARNGLAGLAGFLISAGCLVTPAATAAEVLLTGTERLEMAGDIASNLVAGAHRFLDRELAESVNRRAPFWHRNVSGVAAYEESVATNRARLARILGVREQRPVPAEMEFVSPDSDGQSIVARAPGIGIHRVRWRAFDEVFAEGLLLRPEDHRLGSRTAKGFSQLGPEAGVEAAVIAIPDADETPESLCGLGGAPLEQAYALRLAQSGCQVLIPTLINRQRGLPKQAGHERGRNLSHREYLYRPAFELGRHIIGFEILKVLAAVDWLAGDERGATNRPSAATGRVGVLGWGEGGLLAFYAGALDRRLEVVGVSGFFGPREGCWQEPVERNVFGLLEQFGDAEVASLIAPRALVVEAAAAPAVTVPTGTGGAPGRLVTPPLAAVRSEWERARGLVMGLTPPPAWDLEASGDGTGPHWSEAALRRFLERLAPRARWASQVAPPTPVGPGVDPAVRHTRQLRQLDQQTQRLLTDSPFVRAEYFRGLDTSSPAKYQATAAGYRETFAREVIGRFDQPLLPPRPRSRPAYDAARWTGYEVVLDVFPDLIAYGVLLLPKDLQAGERRPVVVCQHGLEGRPRDVIQGDHPAYHDFAARLAERGFITFAPQNLYLFEDRFRELQRKANPLGKTLFSLMVPQHQQITEWLKTLPFVDPTRIGFYGLSYGGKSAMRIPALVTNYCLSICSADFNEWVWKNASTRSPYSYVWTGEYEIFEFDLGSTFNYAEMAALIAPRPFMVERGHFDGVAPDETVGYEFAKVRNLYAARLGLGDRCEIEWFVGPHTINGKGTFDFLHRHLQWPVR